LSAESENATVCCRRVGEGRACRLGDGDHLRELDRVAEESRIGESVGHLGSGHAASRHRKALEDAVVGVLGAEDLDVVALRRPRGQLAERSRNLGLRDRSVGRRAAVADLIGRVGQGVREADDAAVGGRAVAVEAAVVLLEREGVRDLASEVVAEANHVVLVQFARDGGEDAQLLGDQLHLIENLLRLGDGLRLADEVRGHGRCALRKALRVRTHRHDARVAAEHAVLLAEGDEFRLELLRNGEAALRVDALDVALHADERKAVRLAPLSRLDVAESAERPATELVGRFGGLEVLQATEDARLLPVLAHLGADVELVREDFLREVLANALRDLLGAGGVRLDLRGRSRSRSLDDDVERRRIDGHSGLVNDHVVLKDERLLRDDASLALLLRGLLENGREVAEVHGLHGETPSVRLISLFTPEGVLQALAVGTPGQR